MKFIKMLKLIALPFRHCFLLNYFFHGSNAMYQTEKTAEVSVHLLLTTEINILELIVIMIRINDI